MDTAQRAKKFLYPWELQLRGSHMLMPPPPTVTEMNSTVINARNRGARNCYFIEHIAPSFNDSYEMYHMIESWALNYPNFVGRLRRTYRLEITLIYEPPLPCGDFALNALSFYFPADGNCQKA